MEIEQKNSKMKGIKISLICMVMLLITLALPWKVTVIGNKEVISKGSTFVEFLYFYAGIIIVLNLLKIVIKKKGMVLTINIILLLIKGAMIYSCVMIYGDIASRTSSPGSGYYLGCLVIAFACINALKTLGRDLLN